MSEVARPEQYLAQDDLRERMQISAWATDVAFVLDGSSAAATSDAFTEMTPVRIIPVDYGAAWVSVESAPTAVALSGSYVTGETHLEVPAGYKISVIGAAVNVTPLGVS